LWIGGVGVSSAAPSDRERDWSFPGEPASIGRARRAVVDTCVEWGYGVCEDAELIASELVTNALRHGRLESALASTAPWEIGLRMTDVRPGLRIEVVDGYSMPPVEVPGREDAEGGYGLMIVGRLAAWGWSPTATGKVVWAELRLQAS
jgi:anti-sigma regulatory factor (Ser/Thr protein kinase)